MSAAETLLDAPACTHCTLPVPAGLEDPQGGASFCCSGCHAAWSLLHDGGLENYYRLAERRATPVHASGRSFEEFDHPAFQALHVRELPGGLREIEFYLEGVHCSSCVWLIERVPLALPGMAAAELDVRRAHARVRWSADTVPLSTIARFLDSLGYRPHPFRGARRDALRRAEDRSMLVSIGVAGAIAGNVMTVALALYAGWFGHMEPAVTHYFRWVSLALTAPALLGPGRVFFRGAWSSLRLHTLHMDLPIALALAAGFTRGAINTARGSGPIYFDGVAMLIFLLLAGRFLQQRAQRAAADSAELLASLAPTVARRVEANGVHEVPVESLTPGMVIEVRAGDTIAADGAVAEGISDVEQSLLTGESRPVPVAPGSVVFAGTLNHTARLLVNVERCGEESRLGRIVAQVDAGAARRAPVVQLADRMAGAFVGAVLLLALLTVFAWQRVDPARAWDQAIALLVVTCPCALALATPLAMTVAIGRAARAGLLIKGGDALEAFATPGLIVLDKTGTVTEGRMALAEWHGDDAIRPLVLALERHSTHPLARGFAEAWPGLRVPEASGLAPTPGGGLEGDVGGRHVAVGTPAFVLAHTGASRGSVAAAGDETLTPVWVAVDGRIVATAGFADPVRPEAAAVIAALRSRGWRVQLLSGDDPAVVARVGAALGLAAADCRGGASPEEKLRVIEAEAGRGRVIMVGDGVNDAAAMARATAGIGVRGGMEACLAAADVSIARPGLSPLLELVDGSRRTLAVIRRNIAFSLLYNVAGAALAITGVINPLIAALLMPASSLTVVLASWLGRTFEETP